MCLRLAPLLSLHTGSYRVVWCLHGLPAMCLRLAFMSRNVVPGDVSQLGSPRLASCRWCLERLVLLVSLHTGVWTGSCLSLSPFIALSSASSRTSTVGTWIPRAGKACVGLAGSGARGICGNAYEHLLLFRLAVGASASAERFRWSVV